MRKIREAIQGANNDNVDVQRRRFQRRTTDICMITVKGVACPVKDWSLSGVLFEADSRLYQAGDTLPMTLRFRLGEAIAEVEVTGQVVRKNAHYVATQFDPLSTQARQTLHRVIDESALHTGQQTTAR